MLVPNRG